MTQTLGGNTEVSLWNKISHHLTGVGNLLGVPRECLRLADDQSGLVRAGDDGDLEGAGTLLPVCRRRCSAKSQTGKE